MEFPFQYFFPFRSRIIGDGIGQGIEYPSLLGIDHTRCRKGDAQKRSCFRILADQPADRADDAGTAALMGMGRCALRFYQLAIGRSQSVFDGRTANVNADIHECLLFVHDESFVDAVAAYAGLDFSIEGNELVFQEHQPLAAGGRKGDIAGRPMYQAVSDYAADNNGTV